MNKSHGYARTKIYGIWNAMRSRCENPNVKAFINYGARGISVCERWKKFENFLADMGLPEAGMTLDRIDNDKGYGPDNCRWATKQEQSRNRRGRHMISAFGVTLSMAEWSERSGIELRTLYARLMVNKWNAEDAVSLPLVSHRKGIPRGEKIHKHIGAEHGVTFTEAG